MAVENDQKGGGQGALRRGTGIGTESSFTPATRTRTLTREKVGFIERTALTRRRQARLQSTGSSIGTIAVSWISYRPSPALLGGFIASCCACCSYTRTGRRRASLRFLTMGTRNHTHLGLLTAAQLSVTLLLHRDLRALCVAAWMLLMNDDQVISGTIREWRRCLRDSLQDARHCMYTAYTKARSTQDREREAEHSWHTRERRSF